MRQRPAAALQRQAAGRDHARQVRGQEGDVEAADEEAGAQQQVAAGCAAPCGWPRACPPPCCPAGRRLQRVALQHEGRRQRQQHDQAQHLHRAGPAQADASTPPAIGAITNWPKEPPALTMPVARPRLSGGDQPRGRRHQHRRPGHAGAAGGQHADGEDQPGGAWSCSGVMKVPSATSSTPSEQHAAGADLVGHGAGERLRQPPPQLAEGEGQADAAHAQAGGGVERATGTGPCVWRVPMVSAKVPAAASSTSQTAMRRRARGSSRYSSISPSGKRCQQVHALVDQRVQRHARGRGRASG